MGVILGEKTSTVDEGRRELICQMSNVKLDLKVQGPSVPN